MSCRHSYATGFFFYRPQRSCGKVVFSQASVIMLRGGFWQAPPWADTHLGQKPAWANTPRPPPRADPPPSRRLLQQMIPILLECILVFFFTARNSSCGKVMFSQASVILSGGKVGYRSRGDILKSPPRPLWTCTLPQYLYPPPSPKNLLRLASGMLSSCSMFFY